MSANRSFSGNGGAAPSDLVAVGAKSRGRGMLGMARERPTVIAGETDTMRAPADRRSAANLIPAATEPALPGGARMTTIFPQPHDIGMAAVITRTGLQEPIP